MAFRECFGIYIKHAEYFSIGKTLIARILQWNKQPEELLSFLKVVYSTEESTTMGFLVI